MPTAIRPLLVTDSHTTLTRTLAAAAMGVVVGFAAAISVMQYVPVAIAGNESAMMAACRLPDVDGAITVFTMRDSKLECGRYK